MVGGRGSVYAALLRRNRKRHNADGNLVMTYLAAAIQMTATADKAANLERAERLVRVGAARGANLVALPEAFNWRGRVSSMCSICQVASTRGRRTRTRRRLATKRSHNAQ